MNNIMMSQYIYLLQEREFIKTKEYVYKVGMTKKENHERFNQYPKGSVLLFQLICNNCKNMEKLILKKFKENFKQRKDIGNEYFEGEYKLMIDIIYLTIKDELNINEEIINDEEEIINDEEEITNDEEKKEEQDPEEDNTDKLSEDETEENKICEDVIENPIYKITTYNEWIKYNNIISKVIITNKKREEGFLKFKGHLWIKLYDRHNLNDEENLLGFVQNNQNEKLLFKNKITNEYITIKDYCNLGELNNEKNNYDTTVTNVEYNDEEIIKDILNKCYVKDYDLYDLNYNEYVLHIKHSVNQFSNFIYNSINITFTPVDELISDKILTTKEYGGRCFTVKNIINTNIINTNIVDNILKSLISNDILNEYKKLTYNLLVKQDEKQIIFYDYNDCLLTTWIRDLLFSIGDNKLYALSCQYYDNKLEFKKLTKIHKYRCVVIQKHNPMNVSIKKQINDFCKLGFKNIIVCQNDKQNTMYNMVNFRKHLNDNKEILIKCIKEQNNYEPTNWKSDIQPDDCIFYSQNLLLTNFLKWCCMK
jgi:hypothetical protein